MTHDGIAHAVLRSLDIAILKRTDRRTYELFGETPSFYSALFGEHCTEPWLQSPMLEFFLDDAEAFFTSGASGSLSSGVWQEDGKTEKDNALIATALSFDGTHIISIRLLREEYTERITILRKARTELLEKRNLSQDLEMFKEKSEIDALTGLFNKATFTELMQAELTRSLDLGYPLSLLIIDIDDFKKINDGYGHLTGDKVLAAMAATLKSTVRRNDIVARFGGEEFVALIPTETQQLFAHVARKICTSIAEMVVPGLPTITVSIGCTTYRPGEDATTFIERADLALYDAKTSGKNRVVIR